MDDLFEILADGGMVLTVNRRLARQLAHAFDRRQMAMGHEVWASPEIHPWSAWLERCWDALADAWEPEAWGALPALLNPGQEQALWERIIAAWAEGERPLMNLSPSIRQAAEAWRLLHDWEIDPQTARNWIDPDQQAFAGWAAEFDRLLAERGWLSRAGLPGVLARRPEWVERAPVMALAGFDLPTPAQTALWGALEAQGVALRRWRPAVRRAEAFRWAFPDAETEMRAAADWARTLLTVDPNAVIAIVTPELEPRRAQAARIFSETLHPDCADPTCPTGDPLFGLSLGHPLRDYPLIHDLFVMLDAQSGRLSLTKTGVLLRSPFLAGGLSEGAARALLDVRLRQAGRTSIPLRELARLARIGERPAPRLAEIIERTQAVSPPGDLSGPGEWAHHFAALLKIWGWPGERPLTSRERQSTDAFNALLAALASLDPVVGRIPRAEALARLRQVAAEILHQPETPEPPVRIMGVLEAAGGTFDALWILGASENAWPRSANPNPFLPLDLQISRGMPRAAPETALAAAARLTERLLTSADRIVASHAAIEDDNPARISPLLAHLPLMAAGDSAGWGSGNPDLEEPGPGDQGAGDSAAFLEAYQDAKAPPLVVREGETGGAGLLKAQALCPFQAVARFRLEVDPLEEPEGRLDARGRGELVHQALDEIWRALGSSQGLAALSTAARQDHLRQAAQAAIARAAAKVPEHFPPRFRALEAGRLIKLLDEWLSFEEEERETPFEIAAAEQGRTFAIAGLTLRLRPDRIDRLAGRETVILDYKTGNPNIGDWLQPRLREPQLPLYSLALGKSAAIAFACLKAGRPAFKGLGVERDLLPGLSGTRDHPRAKAFGDWGGLQSFWRESLEALAQDYRAGAAQVDPLRGACQYCGLEPLCRVDALAETLGADLEEMSDAR